jgi:hypothetical protein
LGAFLDLGHAPIIAAVSILPRLSQCSNQEYD